jgi:hypothetical protein
LRSRASLGHLSTSTVIGLAVAGIALAAPTSAAAEATLAVDPIAPCYREQDTVHLIGSGFTPNGAVVFTRDGEALGKPIMADPSGGVFPQLILPGFLSGEKRRTYVATDQTNTSLTAQVSLLVTATDVVLRPEGGPPHRLLTIKARGFFRTGARTLYGHVVRIGKRPGRARNMRIGHIAGACREVRAHKRLFFRDTAPGKYRVQFDTFRRYRPNRKVQTDFIVTVFRNAGTARASALSRAS